MPLLIYRELIKPSRGVGKILYSNEIPISPAVFASRVAYTEQFIDRVKDSVLSSMLQDISEIERILKTSLDIKIEEGKIMGGSRTYYLEEVNIYPSKSFQAVEVMYGSSNIAIDKSEPERNFPFSRKLYLELDQGNIQDHPMSHRLDEFSMPDQNGNLFVPTWYTHNSDIAGVPLNIYFRNFAIMFNNLGLQELEEKLLQLIPNGRFIDHYVSFLSQMKTPDDFAELVESLYTNEVHWTAGYGQTFGPLMKELYDSDPGIKAEVHEALNRVGIADEWISGYFDRMVKSGSYMIGLMKEVPDEKRGVFRKVSDQLMLDILKRYTGL